MRPVTTGSFTTVCKKKKSQIRGPVKLRGFVQQENTLAEKANSNSFVRKSHELSITQKAKEERAYK